MARARSAVSCRTGGEGVTLYLKIKDEMKSSAGASLLEQIRRHPQPRPFRLSRQAGPPPLRLPLCSAVLSSSALSHFSRYRPFLRPRSC